MKREEALAFAEAIALGRPVDVETFENGARLAFADSLFAGIAERHVHARFADPAGGAAIVYGSGTSEERPAAFAVHASFDQDELRRVELIVTRPGEASLFSSTLPFTAQPRLEMPVAADDRLSHAALIAIAEGYFDGIVANDGGAVRVGDECGRFENGLNIIAQARFAGLRANDFTMFRHIEDIRSRRYPIVDPTRGLIVARVVFDVPGSTHDYVVAGVPRTVVQPPRSVVIAEAFRIERGCIVHIEVIMRNIALGGAQDRFAIDPFPR